MTARVEVKPALYRWACQRARLDELEVAARFPHFEAWSTGEKQPTIKQLEGFAKATHVAFGDLFLPEPPDEPLPIADFREKSAEAPSSSLLDTIYAAQRRQDWFKEFATTERLDAVGWIGWATLADSPVAVAARLRRELGLEGDPTVQRRHAGWEAATRALFDRAQAGGVLVSISGVVGNNTRRKLDPGEFRGFSLVDELAPVVFVNGADHKAAHAFTLCHELAHLALGRAGVSNEDLGQRRHDRVEVWCDAVASEILAPSELVAAVRGGHEVAQAARELSSVLRISPLLAVRRVVERSGLSNRVLEHVIRVAVQALPPTGGGSGGDFYATTLRRVGHRFARDVVGSTREGNTSFTEAFRLLGVRNGTGFEELARRLGAIP